MNENKTRVYTRDFTVLVVQFITAERCAILHIGGSGAPMYMKCGWDWGSDFQSALNVVHQSTKYILDK